MTDPDGSAAALRRAAATAPKSRFPDVYRLLATLIVCGAAVTAALDLAERRQPELPLVFRISESKLSRLPIAISSVVSCSCWSGPRNQAQRKYKFYIVNDSDEVVNIGGDTSSQIRLIVAYPTTKPPHLTFPKAGPRDVMVRAASPPDQDVQKATEFRTVRPSQIRGASKLLNVPRGYSVWALPPNPNKVLEQIGESDGRAFTGSYPTVVDKTKLLPGEGYRGNRFGHGTWTFNIPLPTELAQQFAGDIHVVRADADYEEYVIFVGIAVFERQSSDVARLLGFAPAPSDAAMLDPSAF